MTIINLFRNKIGLMPISYSYYKARGLYLLTIKGYKTGIASPSLRQLKKQAWEKYGIQIGDSKASQEPARVVVPNAPVIKAATNRKAYIA